MRSKRGVPRAETDVSVIGTQMGVLVVGSIGYLTAAGWFPSLCLPLGGTAIATAAVALSLTPRYFRLRRETGTAADLGKAFVTFKDMRQTMQAQIRNGFSLLGWGFAWQKTQCQAAKDIMASDWHDDVHQRQTKKRQALWIRKNFIELLWHPWRSYLLLKGFNSCIAHESGYTFLRALAPEAPCYVRTKDLEGHVLVLGTTGAGKTQFLCFSIYESVLKGDPIVVIDPKNDGVLRKSIQSMCRSADREKDFVCFDLAHPELSTPVDLLANSSRATEVASRIVEAQPGQEGEGAAFVEMGRNVVSVLCLGLDLIGEHATFYRLFHYYTNRKELAVKVLRVFLQQKISELMPVGSDLEAQYEELKKQYQEGIRRSADIEQVIFVADLDDEMLMKRTLATYQLLAKFSRDDLQTLFSPRSDRPKSQNFTNVRDLIAQRKVVYVGLDAMTDASLARAVGTLFLADIRSVAGAKYNFADVTGKIRLFVDEAAEICCEPLIQMLNKGRGAGVIMTVATQTIADFTAKLGSEAEAARVLANANTLVALRCNDPETAAFVADRIPKTTVATTMVSHDVAVSADQLAAVGASMGERQVEQETELVPPYLLGVLPNREFFAFVSGGHIIKGRVPLLLPRAEDYRSEE